MATSPSNPPRADAHGLAEALAKNEEATNAVQAVADELVVVHTVLTQEVAKIVGEGDAAEAVERTAALEKKLTETAEKMTEVNEALSDQQASLKHLQNAR
jgi:seryl-tRNA synthetase